MGGFFMNKINNNNLKLAIQKNGRLTDDTLDFLRRSGLEFESYKQKLFSTCRNFPLEILYVRDDDIPNYVDSGTVDLGIVGQNIVNEERPKAKKLLDLPYGICSLTVAVPKESEVITIGELNGKAVATSYPVTTKKFFKENNIRVKILTISGSVEIAPALGLSQAIVDVTSTGSMLALNDLRAIATVNTSQAVLIANKQTLLNGKKDLLKRLMTRFNAALSAKNYKYIMMNVPEDALVEIKRIIPGLKSPTISPLANKGWFSVQTVIQEDLLWETIEQLKQIGASGIIVLPIEKMII